MRITTKPKRIVVGEHEFSIARTTGGVVRVRAKDHLALAAGTGFAHAHDRLVQMTLVRAVGQGRLCELFRADEEALRFDIFMRTMGMARDAEEDVAHLEPKSRTWLEAYCRGVNHYLRTHRRPWELLLLRLKPEPWRPADTLLMIKLLSYVGLAQTQQDAEKFIIQALAAGTPLEKLQRLFRPHLDGVDDELVELLKRTRVFRPIVPEGLPFPKEAPAMRSSNNWAISGRRSETGFPLECHDPHLEVNRLPAMWYELVLQTADDYWIGINMPGIPGLAMGRNPQVSCGFTYGFMDMVDYFLEDCRGGQVRRGAGWVPIQTRRETIRRRKQAPVEIFVRETVHGPLECDPRREQLPDGVYLAVAWSCYRRGASASLDAVRRLMLARDVSEAQDILRHIKVSANWVLADRRGAIGYQQSGALPRRPHSGLFPLPGWEETNDWQGLVGPERLARRLNPPEGYVATANDDQGEPSGPLTINLCQGPDRAERIAQILGEDRKFSLADMKRMQRDLTSLHARRWIQWFREEIDPRSPHGRLLAEWDFRYTADSQAATLFERLYRGLLEEVLGERLFGAKVWRSLCEDTALVNLYFHSFERGLSDETILPLEQRRAAVRRVVQRVFDENPVETIPTWGETQRLTQPNLLLGGKLPRRFGADRGPFPLEGCRSTLVQTAAHRTHGRDVVFHPSYRSVTDLGSDVVETALAGGPSGRPFSRHYASDLDRWREYDYKSLDGADRSAG